MMYAWLFFFTSYVFQLDSLRVLLLFDRSVFTYFIFCFFFSSRRRHTRSLCDWSSDVCSSDLAATRTPKYYEAGQDVTNISDPFESYRQFIGRVIQEYDALAVIFKFLTIDAERSEERRVGKECRSRWSLNDEKKKKKKS